MLDVSKLLDLNESKGTEMWLPHATEPPSEDHGTLSISECPGDEDAGTLEGYDLLVIVARECKEPNVSIEMWQADLDDERDRPMPYGQMATAVQVARKVASRVKMGDRVLVACSEGRNRSALVAGIAWMLIEPISAGEVISKIRELRGESALDNGSFVALLRRFVR